MIKPINVLKHRDFNWYKWKYFILLILVNLSLGAIRFTQYWYDGFDILLCIAKFGGFPINFICMAMLLSMSRFT